MNDFREVEESGLPQFQQLLTLQIALASLAGYPIYITGQVFDRSKESSKYGGFPGA